MPIQLGGPSLAKPKKVNPATYNPLAYVPGGSSPLVSRAIQNKGALGLPKVTIPNAGSIVAPLGTDGGGIQQQTSGDPYGDELRNDPMWSIAQKNYEDALAMGERAQLSEPIARLVSTYGYDPRAYLAAHPDAALPQSALDLANRYIDPAGLAAAQKDPATVSNQIAKSFGQALAGIPNRLAQRGLLGGGSSAIIANKLTYDRALQDRQAMDQFLSGLGTANQNWVNYQTQAANTLRAAQEAIAQRRAQEAGYHGETPPEDYDYSGGPASIFQPAEDVQRIMDQGQASGQWDSWANAMSQTINAANKPKTFKPAPATAKLIQKMRASGEMSAWEKAMKGLGA